jgi:hypothetical protein
MKPSKEQHWRGVIRDYEQSGLTQSDFCEAEQIAYSTFQYWSKRLRGSSENPGFVRVERERKPHHEISVLFDSGIRMIVADDVSSDILSRIICAVNGAICGSTGTR